MSAHQVPQRAGSDARRAWMIGGMLLIAAVILGAALSPVASLTVGASVIGAASFGASLLVFAFGVRGAGSITARRPLGTAALTVLAIWVALVPVIDVVHSPVLNSTSPQSALPWEQLMAFGYVDSLVQFVAALVAAIQIARAGVVPHPWRWAPVWALAAVAVPWVLAQIIAVGAPGDVSPSAMAVMAIEGLARTIGPLFLGIVAIVLANSRRPQTVRVYSTLDRPSL